jgi:hypothetical protein
MPSLDELRAVKRKYSAQLLQQPGVCGVDIEIKDTGDAVLKVHLDTKDPTVRSALPRELDGLPVEYVYTGPIQKLG